jgi:hypothetical protein
MAPIAMQQICVYLSLSAVYNFDKAASVSIGAPNS